MQYIDFIRWLHKNDIDIIDENTGILDGTIKCYAVIVSNLTNEQKTRLNKLKKVVKIGEVQYRYAPEIRYPVIFYKRGSVV